MRVAKMPHVHWDRDSQRFICRRRVPAELQPILGKNPRVHKFKKGVDQKTANDLSLGILGQWQAEFDAVRMQITEQSTPRAVGPRRESLIVVTTIRQPGEALVVGGRNVRLVRSRPDDRDMLVEYIVPDRPAPVPPKPEPAKVAGCTTEMAIGLWRIKRGDDQPKQQALDARRSKMKKFLVWAKKPDDLTVVLSADIQAYKEHLIEKYPPPSNVARDRLTDICALFNVADENRKFDGLPAVTRPKKLSCRQNATG